MMQAPQAAADDQAEAERCGGQCRRHAGHENAGQHQGTLACHQCDLLIIVANGQERAVFTHRQVHNKSRLHCLAAHNGREACKGEARLFG